MHSLPDKKNHQFAPAFLLVDAQHILVQETVGYDMLFFDCGCDISQPVAVEGGQFELQRFGGLLHPFLKLSLKDVGLSFQKEHHFLDHLHVLIPGNFGCTGGETLTHRKVEAWTFPRDELFALAKPEREKLVQVFERVAGRSSRCIGAEV
jgi:hypothetical protein